MSSMSRMTSEGLLKMSKKSYMCQAQLDYFENLLSEQKNKLLDELDGERLLLGNSTKNSDWLDTATLAEERRMLFRSLERKNNLLNKVNKSLLQLKASSEDHPDYGFCEVTGEPIGIERLLTRPTATLTVEAKEQQERNEDY